MFYNSFFMRSYHNKEKTTKAVSTMPAYFSWVTPQESATNKCITSLQCLKLISHTKLLINPVIKITVENYSP